MKHYGHAATVGLNGIFKLPARHLRIRQSASGRPLQGECDALPAADAERHQAPLDGVEDLHHVQRREH